MNAYLVICDSKDFSITSFTGDIEDAFTIARGFTRKTRRYVYIYDVSSASRVYLAYICDRDNQIITKVELPGYA